MHKPNFMASFQFRSSVELDYGSIDVLSNIEQSKGMRVKDDMMGSLTAIKERVKKVSRWKWQNYPEAESIIKRDECVRLLSVSLFNSI